MTEVELEPDMLFIRNGTSRRSLPIRFHAHSRITQIALAYCGESDPLNPADPAMIVIDDSAWARNARAYEMKTRPTEGGPAAFEQEQLSAALADADKVIVSTVKFQRGMRELMRLLAPSRGHSVFVETTKANAAPWIAAIRRARGDSHGVVLVGFDPAEPVKNFEPESIDARSGTITHKRQKGGA